MVFPLIIITFSQMATTNLPTLASEVLPSRPCTRQRAFLALAQARAVEISELYIGQSLRACALLSHTNVQQPSSHRHTSLHPRAQRKGTDMQGRACRTECPPLNSIKCSIPTFRPRPFPSCPSKPHKATHTYPQYHSLLPIRTHTPPSLRTQTDKKDHQDRQERANQAR